MDACLDMDKQNKKQASNATDQLWLENKQGSGI